MNELLKELAKLFAREVVAQLAAEKTPAKTSKAKVKPTPEAVAPAEVFTPDVTADRSESEWRADCLAIIGALAPTHGPQLRALLATYDNAKRLGEVDASALPSLLAELVSLQNG